MKYIYSLLLIVLLLSNCSNSKTEVDLIIHNATIYTVDSAFTITEAIAVKDGKIIGIGHNDFILNTYKSNTVIDATGKAIFPGFIDAHCHFYGYGKGLAEVNLVASKSFKEVIEITHKFYKDNFSQNDLHTEKTKDVTSIEWLIGRGWDQNDWETKDYPSKEILDSLFPHTPVILKRIDGHAALVNQKALDLAKFSINTKIKGGELLQKNNVLTGVLIDNAVDSITHLIPKIKKEAIYKALLKAQKNCLAMGITTVDDAGLEKNIIDAIDYLQKDNQLKMRVYAMLTPTQENLNHYLKNGKYKTEKLNICSFKFYGDGALGSRGACLCHNYTDKNNWKGFLLNDAAYFEQNAALMAEHGFQMNTHCIGDSAAKVIIDIYNKYISNNKDMRWRIEHAQVIDENYFKYFNLNCIPSTQPTHATSDMYWAKERLGDTRVKNAYAYKKLLLNAKIIPLGTDFPVEDISPFKTFYASAYRKDSNGFPDQGFQKENALTREETIKGMTIWAAYANFEEKEKGSLERGKFADFIILDTDLMKCEESKILKTNVNSTYIAGERVYNKH